MKEEDEDEPEKLKLPQFNFDTKIAFRVFLGIIFLIGIILGVTRLANYFSQIEFPTPFPKSTSTFIQIFTPRAPTLTFITALPAKTNTPVFTPSATPLADEFSDVKNIKMRLVPAGTFTMGSENGEADEKPVHEVYLDDYYMDVYEVTNAAYKLCVDDGTCKSPVYTSKYNDSQYADHPVVYVDWNMAKSYCEWRDARLPSEAEWEKAARGPSTSSGDGRTYPWGEDISCDKANYYGCEKNDTTAVGIYESGKSPYGMYDMAGNVWEWVNDWYGETYYQGSPLSNPLGPDAGQYRVLRGGSWYYDYYYVRSAYRLGNFPSYPLLFSGFRCSRGTSP